MPIFDLNQEKISNSDVNKIILFEHLTESNNISIVTEQGDLNLINIMNMSVECVGSISDGISAAQWNTEQELLSIVTS